MKRYKNLLLSLGSALLLSAAWPVSPLTLLIFIAWIPLLWLESVVTSRKRFFTLAYLTMFTWNIASTWWIWNASIPGSLAAFFANSLLMCFPWLGFSIVKRRLGPIAGYISLVAFWMCFEYLHLQDWGLSWPWLTLGNAFATRPEWIQWYEYTGTSGGTLWILLVNIFLFHHLKSNLRRDTVKTYRFLIPAIAFLVLPIVISLLLTPSDKASRAGSNVVIVQPNIDPYEKISDAAGSFEAQLAWLIQLSEQEIDDSTTLVVWPETALFMSGGIEETQMKQNYFLNSLWAFLQRHPRISLFTGIESYRAYETKLTSTARALGPEGFYDAFNGSVLLDSTGALGFYHKSMLVPGVETLPWFLRFIDKWFEKFGGTTAGYARQKERTVLVSKDGYRIAPSICYESIYGEFMSKYIRNGANIICIVTNDGWWDNSPGHKQHMNYARLRAIESRTWVARSANTGISCFIDPSGTVIDPQSWNTAAAIKLQVPVSNARTFYVRYGDMVSPVMVVLSLLMICWFLYIKARTRFLK